MKISIKLKDIKQWLKGKKRLVGVLGAAPVITAATISGSCAAGCPYGLVNDPYPGQCPRYIDANGDGICDLSQASTTSTTDSDTSTSGTDSSTDTQTTSSHGNPETGADQSTDTGAADSSNVTNASNVTADDNGSFDLGDILGDGGTGYHVIPLSMLIVGAYLFTHYLFTKGVLTPKKHKKLWNLLVTGGYLGTGVTGILLIFLIKLGIATLRQPITFWHAELAVLMVVGTLIHIHIYRKSFKNMFKVLFGLGSGRNSWRDMTNSK